MRIIDGHIHVYPRPSARYPAAYPDDLAELPLPEYPVSELAALVADPGVAGFNLVQKRQFGFDNSYLVDAIAGDPARLVGTGLVDVRLPSVAATVRELAGRGIRAFRIHPKLTESEPDKWLTLPGYAELYRVCAELGTVVSAMVGPPCFAELARMSVQFPDTPVVIDHMGSCYTPTAEYLASIFSLLQLARFPRLFIKLSGFYSQGLKLPPYHDLEDIALALIKAFGVSRCLWGSDGPYQMRAPHSYLGSLDFILNLPGLDEGDREWILGKTAEALFFRRA